MLPSFSFTYADLSTWQCTLRIGVHEPRSLAYNLRCLIPYTRNGLTFFSISLLKLNRQCYQVLASHKLIWLHGNANYTSGFVIEP